MRSSKKRLREAKGYTLLSMMFALSAIVLVTTLLLFTITSLKPLIKNNDYTKEAIVFTEQLKHELSGAKNVSIDKQKLFFDTSQGAISYSLTNHYVRRQVNGLGNDIVLLKTQAISFSMIGEGGVKVVVKGDDGSTYDSILIIFKTERI